MKFENVVEKSAMKFKWSLLVDYKSVSKLLQLYDHLLTVYGPQKIQKFAGPRGPTFRSVDPCMWLGQYHMVLSLLKFLLL